MEALSSSERLLCFGGAGDRLCHDNVTLLHGKNMTLNITKAGSMWEA